MNLVLDLNPYTATTFQHGGKTWLLPSVGNINSPDCTDYEVTFEVLKESKIMSAHPLPLRFSEEWKNYSGPWKYELHIQVKTIRCRSCGNEHHHNSAVLYAYEVERAAVALGSKGGSAKTEAQQAARRANGAKGGRPRK